MQASDTVLENRRFHLEINPVSGCIASLFDKKSKLEVFKGEAARPAILEDKSNSWSHHVFQYNEEIAAFQATSVKLVSHGPVKAMIRVESEYNLSRLAQEFTMYADLNDGK